jgi:hypothetical protein
MNDAHINPNNPPIIIAVMIDIIGRTPQTFIGDYPVGSANTSSGNSTSIGI